MQQCMKSDISSTHEHREQWYLPCAGTDTDTRVCGGRGSRDRGVAVAKVIAAGLSGTYGLAGAAPVVGRRLCIAIFGGKAKGFYRVGLCVWM